ncbi:lysine exporter LysO family protein [Moraxella sp. ZJ142]|uniref:lysine exporter LysO family protein n=1 Tax=Moraxella marmotae TaxID=3344520 RepID=UPI0035D4BFEB
MQGIITLILILSPMLVGFALPASKTMVAKSNAALNYLVYLILIVIGIELGLVDDLLQKVGDIAKYLGVLIALSIGTGSLALMAFDRLSATKATHHRTHASTPKVSLHGSLVQLVCLGLGFLMAKFLPPELLPPPKTTTVLLMLLLFLVGISLKGSGVGLKQALIDKRGLQISAVFMLCTTASGAVFALIFDDVSPYQGLALASGYGWYSLSGTIMTDAYGAVWGSVALLNDLAREVLALIFIPWVMRYSPSAAIGLGGVTSLDFTLPTILQSGGTHIMPTVISFGFITNVVSPILMVFFSSF